MKQRIIKLVYIYIAQLKYKNTFIALNDILKRWVIKSSTHIGSGRNTFLIEVEEICIVRGIQFTTSCGYPFDSCDLVNRVKVSLNQQTNQTLFQTIVQAQIG